MSEGAQYPSCKIGQGRLSIRWMIRRDMEEVLRIEAASFDEPWGEIDLIRVLRSRSTIGVVAELDGSVEGFAVYDLLPKMIRLVNFAVCPTIRRRGIGSAMLSKLVAKLTPGRRSRLEATVRETNLGAQKFFASQGFRAVRVVAGCYDNTEESGYLFRYTAAASPALPQ